MNNQLWAVISLFLLKLNVWAADLPQYCPALSREFQPLYKSQEVAVQHIRDAISVEEYLLAQYDSNELFKSLDFGSKFEQQSERNKERAKDIIRRNIDLLKTFLPGGINHDKLIKKFTSDASAVRTIQKTLDRISGLYIILLAFNGYEQAKVTNEIDKINLYANGLDLVVREFGILHNLPQETLHWMRLKCELEPTEIVTSWGSRVNF